MGFDFVINKSLYKITFFKTMLNHFSHSKPRFDSNFYENYTFIAL